MDIQPTQQIPIDPAEIKAQTDALLADLGFDNVDEGQKSAIVDKIQEMVDTEVLHALVSRLEDEQLASIEEVLKELDDEAEKSIRFIELIKESLPNYQDIIAKTIERLYKEIRSDIHQLENFMAEQDQQQNHQPAG